MGKGKGVVIGVVLVLSILTMAFVPPVSNSILYWKSIQELNWQDYKGHPETHDHKHVVAMTYSGIMIDRYCEGENIEFKVQAYFEKERSWVKRIGMTPHYLRHEQLHFNITEIYARLLINELSQKGFKCGEEIAFEAFVEEFLLKWREEQIIYDLETEYSNELDKQAEWETFIQSRLNKRDILLKFH